VSLGAPAATVPCWYCGSTFPGRRVREHKIPLRKGGSDSPPNVVPACCPCNSLKGDRTHEEWRLELAAKRGALFLFYGEKETIVIPPNYWKLPPVNATCSDCSATIVVSGSKWRVELTKAGWRDVYVRSLWAKSGLKCNDCVNKLSAPVYDAIVSAFSPLPPEPGIVLVEVWELSEELKQKRLATRILAPKE
jgi:HNH endonuclease